MCLWSMEFPLTESLVILPEPFTAVRIYRIKRDETFIIIRNLVYNRTVEQILKLEQEGSIFVIRPEQPLNIGRLEKNPENVQRVYEIGYADGKKYVESLVKWMEQVSCE